MTVAPQLAADIAGMPLEVVGPVAAALLGGAVTLLVTMLTGRTEALKLRSQYRHKERTKLRELIGDFHGRMLETAVDWDRRMWQLYTDDGRWLHEEDGRHVGPASYADREQYMPRSYVFRFLSRCAIARKFETQALYIDSRDNIASERDLVPSHARSLLPTGCRRAAGDQGE
jgi:hypothetical protein